MYSLLPAVQDVPVLLGLAAPPPLPGRSHGTAVLHPLAAVTLRKHGINTGAEVTAEDFYWRGRQDGNAEREARDALQDARTVTLGMDPCYLLSRFPTAFPRHPRFRCRSVMVMGDSAVL